jgi:hypothetical protein
MGRKSKAKSKSKFKRSLKKTKKELSFQNRWGKPIFPFLSLSGQAPIETKASRLQFARIPHGVPSRATRKALLHLIRPLQFAQKFYAMR